MNNIMGLREPEKEMWNSMTRNKNRSKILSLRKKARWPSYAKEVDQRDGHERTSRVLKRVERNQKSHGNNRSVDEKREMISFIIISNSLPVDKLAGVWIRVVVTESESRSRSLIESKHQ